MTIRATIKRNQIPLAAFALAFAARLIFLFDFMATPYGRWPLLDAAAYHEWAMRLASGQLFSAEAFYQSPLYPYFLGLFYALFSPSLWLAGALNVLLGASTALILTRFSLQQIGRKAAWVTAFLFSLYRADIFFTPAPMKEPLALFLMALFLVTAFRGTQKNETKDHIFAGLLIGLAALTRGNALLLAPAYLFLLFFRYRKRAAKPALLFSVTVFLAITPATLHNAVASKDFVLMNYDDGFNFYIGHSPYANGTNAYPQEVSTDPVRESANISFIARNETGKNLKPSEVSAYWRARTWQEIERQPWREFTLIKNKILAFWNGHEQFDNYDAPFIEKNFDTLLSWPLVNFWVLSALAAFSLPTLLKKKKDISLFLLVMLAAYFASIFPFYVTDRYRLPVILFLIPLASGLPLSLDSFKKKEGLKRMALSFSLLFFFAYLGLRPSLTPMDLRAFNWGTLASIYGHLHEPQKAIEALEKGTAISKTGVGASAYILSIDAALSLGQIEKASQLFKEAQEAFPQNGRLRYFEGRKFAAQGNLIAAEKAFMESLRLEPSNGLTYYALAKIYEKQGQKEKAATFIKRGLSVDPANKWLRSYTIKGRGSLKPGV